MSLLLLGLGHHTTPIAVRETCRISPVGIRAHLADLAEMQDRTAHAQPRPTLVPALEAIIVSTCNRLEFYIAAEAATGDAVLRTWLRHLQRRSHNTYAPYLAALRDRAAVEHLLHVAGGLEAVTLGEPYFLAELTDALALARSCGTAGPQLTRLFRDAIQIGQHARGELARGSLTTRIFHAAFGAFSRRHPELAQGNILVIGAGRMAQLVVQTLCELRVEPIAITNRTPLHAETLAHQGDCQVFPWHQLRTALAWADVVIAATSARSPILDAGDIMAVLPQRRRYPLLLIDLGLPRNIHPAATQLAGIHYYDLDTVNQELAELALAEVPAPAVRRMIEAEATALWTRLDRAAHAQ